jgi:hypothetical protein
MTSASTWENMSALGGTRTPNLLIRSKIRAVQRRPELSDKAAHGGLWAAISSASIRGRPCPSLANPLARSARAYHGSACRLLDLLGQDRLLSGRTYPLLARIVRAFMRCRRSLLLADGCCCCCHRCCQPGVSGLGRSCSSAITAARLDSPPCFVGANAQGQVLRCPKLL